MAEPQVDGGVCAPWPPTVGELFGVADCHRLPDGVGQGSAKPEVRRRERVGFTETQRYVVRRPGTEAGNGCDRLDQPVKPAAAVEGDGNEWVKPRLWSPATAAPCRATICAVIVPAPATLTCWPTMARTPISNGSQVPGTRSPRRLRTSGPMIGSPSRCRVAASTSASR